jgi:hypothetical protein
MNKIHGEEQKIGDVFSTRYAFNVPLYQRPYKWESEQANELFDDILTSCLESNNNREPYFLGSIVLIKEDGNPESQIIDGQQRLTTLSLLISVLLKALPKKISDGMKSMLYEEGNAVMGTRDRYRIRLRERDNNFYEENVLKCDSFDKIKAIEATILSEPQRWIRNNLLLFVERVNLLSEDDKKKLATYLVQNTYLIVVSTPSLESAFRIFSVLNDRGLDLTVADILKAEIIGKINNEDQENYTKKWENAEEILGSGEFANLFSFIRFIYSRKKQKTTILKEFREFVTGVNDNSDAQHSFSPVSFIDDQLTPYTYALDQIRNHTFVSANDANTVNGYLRDLSRMEENDWVAPAILFHSKNNGYPSKLKTFYSSLERLSSVMWLLGYNVNNRIDRYGKLLESISSGQDISAADSPIQLTAGECNKALGVIDGDIYNIGNKLKRTMVLLRLDELLSSGEATYSYPIITIEHVLPQNPSGCSKWIQWWNDPVARERDTHRLGNLVLLNRRQNSSANNYEFEYKKTSYFSNHNGISPFAITTQVIHENEWTPSVFERRQKLLVSKLKDAWRL